MLCRFDCTSQFKQHFLFSNLHVWEIEFRWKITWNFFATSQCKGAIDRIGGFVKQSVWRVVKIGKNHISDASEYASFTKEQKSDIILNLFHLMK